MDLQFARIQKVQGTIKRIYLRFLKALVACAAVKQAPVFTKTFRPVDF